MGMLASFTAISAEEFKQVQDDPDLMESLLYNDDEDEDDDGEGGSGHPEMDVDKAWHGIHYLLNQSADGGEGPLVGVILGGEPIGDDMGMGPARVLTPAEVKAASQALDALTIEPLRPGPYDRARHLPHRHVGARRPGRPRLRAALLQGTGDVLPRRRRTRRRHGAADLLTSKRKPYPIGSVPTLLHGLCTSIEFALLAISSCSNVGTDPQGWG